MYTTYYHLKNLLISGEQNHTMTSKTTAESPHDTAPHILHSSVKKKIRHDILLKNAGSKCAGDIGGDVS